MVTNIMSFHFKLLATVAVRIKTLDLILLQVLFYNIHFSEST